MPEFDVLIVDDQAPFRAVARALLRLVSVRGVIGEVETGEQAVDYALRHRPGLILMDIHLPGIDGDEATRRILAAAPETKIILVSTYAADDLTVETRTCGALAYIRKDELTPARLRDVVASPGAGP